MINIEIGRVAHHLVISVGIFDRLREPVTTGCEMEEAVASLRIPERFRVGVAAVASLPDASFSDLVAALKQNSVGETAKDLSEQIGPSVKAIPSAIRESIVASVAAMQGVQKSSHADTARFTSDIWEALSEDEPELVEDIDGDTLKSRMTTLLSEISIHLTSTKVSQLRAEVERSFCGARVLTDVRTAFPDDATQQPAMTVMHTLEVMFHDDMGRHREFYVALEDNDLIILKDVVDRAIQKKKTLSALLKQADFNLYE